MSSNKNGPKSAKKSTRKGAKKSTGFDVKEWSKSKANPQTCQTCLDKQVKEAIKTILVMMVNGESHVSFPQIQRMLAEHFDYPFGVGALKKHIKNCETLLWNKLKSDNNE